MRVLTLTNMFPPEALGGYELSCADVMQRFVAAGHEVRVLTTDTELPDGKRVVGDAPDGVSVTRSLHWYWHDHQFVQPRLRRRLALELHNRRELRGALSTVRPDVVSVWGMGGMSLSLIETLNRSGLPVVYVVCDEWPVYGPRADAWIARATDGQRRGIARAVGSLAGVAKNMPAPRDATFCWLSEFVRGRVLSATGWQPVHETVTRSGIDLDDFPLAAASERPWRWRLLAVGRIEPRKGFAAAVEALSRLPREATLRILGPDDGIHAQELRQLAATLRVGDRLTIGSVPRSELHHAYDDADALLFTSAWEEPFGLVPIEAMARALPVVAVPTGGAREYLVDGTNCVTVPTNDGAAFATAVQQLAEDGALRARVVAGGSTTASTLTVDRLAGVLLECHQAAMT